MFKRMGRDVLAAVVTIALIASPASADDDAPKPAVAPLKALIVTGGEGHDWRAALSTIRHALADTGRFDARVIESPTGLTSATLAGYDVIIDDFVGSTKGGETEAAIAGFVASGKGVVITRRGLGLAEASKGEPSGPMPAFWPAVPKGSKPSPVEFLDVKLARPEHPIVKGMAGEFKLADSLPLGLVVGPSSEVIATAAGKSGEREPVLIASGSGSGRVVCLALGCDVSAMHEKAFRAALARAAEWAATGAVTLAAEPAAAPSKAAKVKALLVTGGHDHEAAFYNLFAGYDEIDKLPVLTSELAFKADIRGKYDVIIMYDFTREIEEPARKNLRDYVEAGGGIVVLHHALLNFQGWDWWGDDAVGGSYRLRRVGDVPSSGVKDGQQLYVTPVGDHPVTAGLAPFHIEDETYNHMRMSPKVRPLLTTDNPASDRDLAWVGPLEGSKVVAIQLGHGPTAFGHPSYRKLVHNAVVWAAGKAQ